MALIAFDARDAFVPMPHGSGVYVARLLAALQRGGVGGHELWPVRGGGPGPEVLFEQLTLPRLLRRRGAALLHAPDSFLPLRRSCPAVLTVHDLGFESVRGDMPLRTGLKYRALVRAGARSAERVICPSRFTAGDVMARYRVPEDRIRVIPEAPALPVGELAPPDGPYVLAAGDLRPKKNLPVLIGAYRSLRRRGLPHRLVLAGADLGLAESLRLLAGGEPVELPGFVSDAQLDALIRGAAALVLPSVYEGFGLIALEAMARGCPTLLARAGALPETGGEAARYFDPGSAEELTELLASVLGDSVEQARLRAAGRARAATFSWERAAAETVAVYEELL
ncbi:MAG TPA: glycosyltransferase family 1 protein [Solirubrobacteraceae bacterium]|nr:glycosyltransferase family 1 protein [Solirubrobacteraceae bacterium]